MSERSVAIELLPLARGAHAIAWSASWGAAAMIVRELAPGARRVAHVLGTPGRWRHEAPRLFHLAEGIGVAWIADEGAMLAVLDPDGVPGEPRMLHEGGRSLCVAAGRRASQVFVEDGATVRAIEVRADGTSTPRHDPLIEQTGRLHMSAARAGDASLLVAAYEADRRLVIVDAAKGARSAVRHELARWPVALDANGAGTRAVIALAYHESDALEAGIVDAEGKMVERLHAIARTPGAPPTHLRALWVEDAFHVAARADGRVSLVRLDGTRVLEIPRVEGPFALAYHQKGFVLAQALAQGEAPALRLFFCDAEGGRAQQIELPEPAPDAIREHRAQQRAERCIEQLEAALGGAGYRDSRGARMSLQRGAGLALPAEGVAITIHPEGERLRIALVPLDAPAEREGSLERLGRWVRDRLSRDGRAASEPDRLRAVELAAQIDGELVEIVRTRSGPRLAVVVASPPDGPRLASWIRSACADRTRR